MPHGALSVLLQRRAIPIINENDTVSVEELKIGDNDTLSAQVAAMIQADLLVLLTDIDGLYTGNPNSNPDAVRLDKIEHINHEIIEMAGGSGSANGTGGMLTKIKAATIAAESGVPVYICSSLKPDSFTEAAEHQADGSFFVPVPKVCGHRSNGWRSIPKAGAAFMWTKVRNTLCPNKGKAC